MKISIAAAAAVMATTLIAMPAAAQDTDPPKAITVTGDAAIVSDYRFRGVSRSDEDVAVQGGVTVAHESGFYAGAWASTLRGWGASGGADLELDLIGGYRFNVTEGGTLDVGATWYLYPGGARNSGVIEPYAKLSGTIGPLTALAGVAYAPKQQALANVSGTGGSRSRSEDNLYLWGDFSAGIPRTPVTARAHIGYSDGNPGLGPNGASMAPTGRYWDWSLGADYALGAVTLGAAYVDTDITRAESAYLLPTFASRKDGGPIAGPQVVFSVRAAF